MRKVLAALLCGVLSVVLVACSGSGQAPEGQNTEKAIEVVPKKLDEYSWAELKEISSQIAQAESDEAGREIAKKYGLVSEDGSLSDQTKMIVLDDTRALDIRLAGIRHDEKSDGSGRAGLTFMTVGAVDIRPMNDEDTVEGGWEATTLRAWLNEEMPKRLDADLSEAIVAVNKLTNNVGRTDNPEDVTQTSDKLWAFSVHEVCGDVTWDVDEFQQKRGYEDIDGLVNVEGEQYEVFAQAGVTGAGDPSGILSLAASTGASPWWYRTPYPFDWQGYGDTGVNGYFFRVMDTGYPESIGAPQDPSSVVVGFSV